MGKVKGSDAGKDLWWKRRDIVRWKRRDIVRWKRRDIVRCVYMTADSDCVSTMGARALCLV